MVRDSTLRSDGLPSIRAWDRASTSSLPRVGHRELRQCLGPLLGRVHEHGGAMEVVNGGQHEVVVLAHSVFEDLVETARGADKLREAMQFLLVAATAGVHVPSETLDRLGLTPPDIDVDATKRLRSRYPLAASHGEGGEQLSDVTLSAELVAFDDDEDDLVFVDGEH